MGRIRTVKPELFLHDELYDTEEQTGMPVRLAYIGLFTVADREGRFIWKARQLKAQIMPYDDLDFTVVLNALKKAGFIQHYGADGKEYGVIASFLNHQNINSKEAKSKIPKPEEGVLIELPEPVAGSSDEFTSPVTGKKSNTDTPLNEFTSPVNVIPMNTDEFTSPVTETNKNSNGEGKGRERKGREGVVSNDTCPAEAEPSAPKASHAEKIQEVFAHWQAVLNHPQAKLDDNRKKFIRNALKSGYTVDQLKQAIDGCSRTPHNMGDNDRNQVYDGIHIIFKSADQIDRFIGNAGNRLVSQMSKAGRSTQAAGEALMAEMFGEDTHGY